MESYLPDHAILVVSNVTTSPRRSNAPLEDLRNETKEVDADAVVSCLEVSPSIRDLRLSVFLTS